jgi:hypothetical protein
MESIGETSDFRAFTLSVIPGAESVIYAPTLAARAVSGRKPATARHRADAHRVAKR